eukprot:evm.model.NODE_3753_length_1607_cov_32.425014.1
MLAGSGLNSVGKEGAWKMDWFDEKDEWLEVEEGKEKERKEGGRGGDKRRRPGKAGLKKDIRCDDVQEKSGQTKVKRIEAGEKKEKRGGGRDLLLCVVSVLQGKLQEGAAC